MNPLGPWSWRSLWLAPSTGGGVVDPTPAWTQGTIDNDFAGSRYWDGETEYASYAAWAAAVTLSITGDVNRTYFDAAGVMQNASANALRFDHNPATLVAYGLRLEGARTNIKVRSQEWTNASFYSSVRVTGAANAIAAPDGTTTAESFLETATTNTFHQDSAAITISTATIYSYSAFLKKLDRRYLSIDSANVAAVTTLDLDGIAVAASSGAERNGGGIVPINNGWNRAWNIFTETASTSINPRVWINELSTDGITGTHVGDTAKGFYGWGMQLEAGAFPSSYIRTIASSTVARAADTFTETVAHEATASIRLYFRTPAGKEGDQVLWQRDDGSEDNRIRCVRDSSGNLRWIVTNATVEIVNLDLGVVADLTVGYTDFSWATDDYAASLNGGDEETDTGGTMPTGLTTIRRGHNVAGTSNWFGHMLREVRGVTKSGAAPFSLKIGYATDLHSSQAKEDHDSLFLENGPEKATATVAFLNTQGLDLAVFGGDLIETYGMSFDADDAAADLNEQVPIWDGLTVDWHFVPGNHDFDKLTRAQLETILGQSSDYRSFDHGGLHHVIIDGCYTEAGAQYSAGNFDTNGTDTNLPEDELDWLEADLAATTLPTIVWTHQRLDSGSGGHVINAADVRTILEAAPNGVVAVIQGHHHTNALVYDNLIPYVEMKDMVTDSGDTDTTCAVIQITDDHIIITGQNDQTSRTLVRRR